MSAPDRRNPDAEALGGRELGTPGKTSVSGGEVFGGERNKMELDHTGWSVEPLFPWYRILVLSWEQCGAKSSTSREKIPNLNCEKNFLAPVWRMDCLKAKKGKRGYRFQDEFSSPGKR